MPAHSTRRALLKAGSFGLLTFTLGCSVVKLSPAEAEAAGVPLASLTREEADTLAALGERLVPGSREAGGPSWIINSPPARAIAC